jgi:hypothetical protein
MSWTYNFYRKMKELGEEPFVASIRVAPNERIPPFGRNDKIVQAESRHLLQELLQLRRQLA